VALAHLSNDTVQFTSFLFTMAITFVSVSEFNLLKCSHFLNSFELLGNRKKPTLIFTVITLPALAGAGEVLQLVCLFVRHTMYIMY